jgi:hypothetical protein
MMAIAYDFDGTLAPGNMQEHQFLPDIGMTPAAFWKEVHDTAKQHQADEVLVYMNLMLRKASAHNVPVRREDFKRRGKSIQLFDGVADWNKAAKYLNDGRVHVAVPAIYTEGAALDKIIKARIEEIAARYALDGLLKA